MSWPVPVGIRLLFLPTLVRNGEELLASVVPSMIGPEPRSPIEPKFAAGVSRSITPMLPDTEKLEAIRVDPVSPLPDDNTRKPLTPADLDGTITHRYLLWQVTLFAVATRDLYITRYKRLRGEKTRALHLHTPRGGRMNRGPGPIRVLAHMDIRPFTESQSSAALLTCSTRWSDAQRLAV